LHQGRIFVGWTWDHWSDSGYSFDLKVWNGSALLDPQPAVGGSEESLLCLLSLNERLYAGGHFADMASTPARNIAEWSDGNWHAVVEDYAASLGLPRSIRATTCLPNGRLIVSDGRRVHEWRYDSWASWTWPYAEYYDGYVLLALGHIAGELVVGGYKCNYMEINEDELWSLLWIPELRSRSSFSGQMIVEIFNHDSHCYVGFKSSLDDVVIREYLQDEWIELDGVPIGLACHEFGSYRGFLVAGGSFHEAGGEPAGNLAIWDGSRWAGFTSGVDGPVYCLLQFGDDLVVAGDFLEAGGQSVGRIASWDGEDWRSLGDGFDDAVHDLVLHEGILVAGGRFHHSGDDSVSSLAFWNGSTWRDLGGGIGGLVNEMTSVPDEGLFIGGNFQTAGNTPSLNIALWEGSIVGTWLAGLTARRDGGAVLIAWELGELEPGAGFHIWREEVRDGAGRIRLTAAPLAAGLAGAWTDPAPPPGAALYRLQLVAPDGGTRWLGSAELPAAPPPALRLDAAPNPFNPRTTIRYRLPVAQQATLAVHDLRGRLVRVLAEGRRTAGEHSATWDGLDRRGAAVAAGVYLLRLQTPDGVRSRKLVLAR
jgi:hypothetical protein